MAEFQDEIDILASAGLCRRQSNSWLPVRFSSYHSDLNKGLGDFNSKSRMVYRILVLGPSRVGKTSIIKQFLYDHFDEQYKPTVQEMYRVIFDVDNMGVCFNIEDTCGTFTTDFPAMFDVSIAAADAVLLVFSIDDQKTFQEVTMLREKVHSARGAYFPIVVVGNKTDLQREIEKDETEMKLLMLDWENAYVECSAKGNLGVSNIFKSVLFQVKIDSNMTTSTKSLTSSDLKRRQSLPLVPIHPKEVTSKQQGECQQEGRQNIRKKSLRTFSHEECKMC